MTSVVQTKGIYHALPTYPDSQRNLTAIITGANGISGQYLLRVLAQEPQRWSKIYCLSRRPPPVPEGLPKQAQHIPLDFLKEPQEIANVLKEHNVTADHVFFYAYIQAEPKPGQGLWSDAEEMTRVNSTLFNNFVNALPLANIKPKRFMLQTGAKQYGIHLGSALTPQFEDDPRVTIEPNFYYPQEDKLFEYSKQESVGWSVVRPSFILGAVPDAAMNVVYPIGIYAAVCKHLGQPIDWPGSIESWEAHQTMSSAGMNAYLAEWTVLATQAKDQAFNALDGAPFAWGRLWPKLAQWYGIDYKVPDVNANYIEREVGYDPPPRGFGGKRKMKIKFTLTQWGKQPEVQQAWRELAQKHDLRDKEIPDPDRVLAFTDGSLLSPGGTNLSSDKCRKMGFHGYVDSRESMLEVLNDFVRIKMLPPLENPNFYMANM